MKKTSSSNAAKATLSALFFICSIVFTVVALATPGSRSTQHRRSAAAARLQPAAILALPPAPANPADKLGFENFEGPGVLTNVSTSSQGQPVNTVEYVAHDAGEPSIGVNWSTNVTAFQSDLQTLFVTFDDSCNLAHTKDTWVNRPAKTSQGVDQDPIGFTDRVTGRTFAAELTLTSPTCKTSKTDDDGLTWVPSTGAGFGQGIDHETLGGGPFHAPFVTPPPPAYPHAVYYCVQLPHATCALSVDGGNSFGPGVEIDPVADANCIGIHGHVKVGPDGTAYVPTANCNGMGSVIVSENNGATWTIQHVPGTTSPSDIIDAQVATDNNGKLYFIMANGDGTPVVATADLHGTNWTNVYNIGASVGVLTTGYPYVTAADKDRAAVAFYGSTKSAGASGLSDHGFHGVWHLYVAATYDGGQTWTTTDATPNDPLQRGCIWARGGADICRNLLDFIGMTVDNQGRIEVGYVDGCPDGDCAQAPVNPDGSSAVAGNSYTARGAIARQSSGRRLVAQFDPASPTSAPGMPLVTERRVGHAVHLGWSEADDGNSPITGYQIFRGTAAGAESLLTTLPATQTRFDDLTATDTTKTYYYKVLAANALGTSCANNEVAAPYVGNGCTGFIVQKTPPGHPEQNGGAGVAPASLAIDYVAVAEPPGTSNFLFQMKTTSLATVPPNSRWRIVWNSYASAGEQFYVGMTTDQNSTPSFEYGSIATGVVALVIGVPTETKIANALAGSNFNADGTISIVVPKSVFGNPQPGDLLGAVNGRTFTGDTPQTNTLERSNALIDHTFAKAQRDNGHPAATYTVLGNDNCEGGIVPLSAVSRKNHPSAGTRDLDLPLSGNLGVECRKGQGQNSDQHQVVVTFDAPVTLNSASVPPGKGSVTTAVASGSQVFVNLTVPNGTKTAITMNVFDGTNTGSVVIPMGVLLGDVDGTGRVDADDVTLVRQNNFQPLTQNPPIFKYDVDVSGRIDADDVTITRQQNFTILQ